LRVAFITRHGSPWSGSVIA